MTRTIASALTALFIFTLLAAPSSHALTLGVGANYWKAVNDIELDDFDDDGLSYYASLQLELAELVSIDFMLERFKEGFGGSPDDVYAPQVFFILGGGLYAGVGAGVYYVDGDFLDDPFFALRAGFNIELLPNIYLDLNANYRFEDWDQVNDNDIDENTIMLGAAARIEL